MITRAIYDTTTNRVIGTASGDSLQQLATGFMYVAYDPAEIPDPRGLAVVNNRVVPGSEVPETPQEAESRLLNQIDIVRNDKQMQYLTRGTSLSLEYMAIQLEYKDYTQLGPTLLAALNLADTRKRWPTASVEVALTKKTLAQVMATYGVAIAANDKANRVIGRIAVDAKNRLKAATTVAAKQAIYASINWNWTPGF